MGGRLRRVPARVMAFALIIAMAIMSDSFAHAQTGQTGAPAADSEPKAIARPAPNAAADAYRDARTAMGKGETDEAIRLFQIVAQRYPASAQAAPSLYYRAFLQYQQYKPDVPGSVATLRAALHTIELLEGRYPGARQANDAKVLRTRICGELAALGDQACRAQVVAAARQPVPKGPESANPREIFRPVPETPTLAPGQWFGMGAAKELVIPIDTSCRQQQALNAYVSALSSLWKVDTLKAIENTAQVLTMRNGCLTNVRRQALTMAVRRPEPLDGLRPTIFETALNDPDPVIRQIAVAWLQGQEWSPRTANFLKLQFNREFRVRATP